MGFSRQRNRVAIKQQSPLLNDRRLSSEVPLNRLTEHFSAYIPAHWYSATRSEIFKKCLGQSLEINLDLFAIFELVEEFLVVSAGKTCVLPELYWLRSKEAKGIRNTGDERLDPRKRFDAWWLDDIQSIANQRH